MYEHKQFLITVTMPSSFYQIWMPSTFLTYPVYYPSLSENHFKKLKKKRKSWPDGPCMSFFSIYNFFYLYLYFYFCCRYKQIQTWWPKKIYRNQNIQLSWESIWAPCEITWVTISLCRQQSRSWILRPFLEFHTQEFWVFVDN